MTDGTAFMQSNRQTTLNVSQKPKTLVILNCKEHEHFTFTVLAKICSWVGFISNEKRWSEHHKVV